MQIMLVYANKVLRICVVQFTDSDMIIIVSVCVCMCYAPNYHMQIDAFP